MPCVGAPTVSCICSPQIHSSQHTQHRAVRMQHPLGLLQGFTGRAASVHPAQQGHRHQHPACACSQPACSIAPPSTGGPQTFRALLTQASVQVCDTGGAWNPRPCLRRRLCPAEGHAPTSQRSSSAGTCTPTWLSRNSRPLPLLACCGRMSRSSPPL